MEQLFVFAFVITLAFFVTAIALVAIVFGQHKVVDQAVQALSQALKTIFK